MSQGKVWIFAWLLASFIVTPTVCFATSKGSIPSIDLRVFRPSTSADASLYLESSQSPGAWQGHVGSWFSYMYRPVVVRASDGSVATSIIGHQLTMDVVGSIGISDFGALGVSVPSILYQHGDENAVSASVRGPRPLVSQALGDIALTAKVSLVRYELGGFGLAALGQLSLPTGETYGFAGEGKVTSELRLLAEYHLLAASIRATSGFKVRTRERSYDGDTWGNEIPWGVGVSVFPRAFGWDENGKWTWSVEAYGHLPAGPEAPFTSVAQSPAVTALSARYEVARDFFVTVGVHSPITRAVGVPDVGGVLGFSYAPKRSDMDEDGIDDQDDECPELAEDIDGDEDDDGCPDF